MKKLLSKIIRRLHAFDMYDFDRLMDLFVCFVCSFLIYEIVSYVNSEYPETVWTGSCIAGFLSLCYAAYHFGCNFLFESKEVRMNKY